MNLGFLLVILCCIACIHCQRSNPIVYPAKCSNSNSKNNVDYCCIAAGGSCWVCGTMSEVDGLLPIYSVGLYFGTMEKYAADTPTDSALTVGYFGKAESIKLKQTGLRPEIKKRIRNHKINLVDSWICAIAVGNYKSGDKIYDMKLHMTERLMLSAFLFPINDYEELGLKNAQKDASLLNKDPQQDDMIIAVNKMLGSINTALANIRRGGVPA